SPGHCPAFAWLKSRSVAVAPSPDCVYLNRFGFMVIEPIPSALRPPDQLNLPETPACENIKRRRSIQRLKNRFGFGAGEIGVYGLIVRTAGGLLRLVWRYHPPTPPTPAAGGVENVRDWSWLLIIRLAQG